MDEVKKLPYCSARKSGKLIWNEDDTEYGVDVPVWVQNETDVDCDSKKECEKKCKDLNAIYFRSKSGNKCFAYDVVDSVCLVVEKKEGEYIYRGGCFEAGSHLRMKTATPETVYELNDVKIEVRNYSDPIIYAGRVTGDEFDYDSILVGV